MTYPAHHTAILHSKRNRVLRAAGVVAAAATTPYAADKDSDNHEQTPEH